MEAGKNGQISVILPVYGVEAYLDRCMESLVKQTHRELEILLVDDGSPDRCPALCDAWARRDDRVRVIHQTNAGVSAARNTGLSAARGEAVIFLDPDDWVEPRMLEQMFRALKKQEADLVVCGFTVDFEDHSLLRRVPEGTLYGQAALAALFTKEVFSAVWNKLFRRTALQSETGESLLFPEGISIGEDFLWLTRVLVTDRKAYLLPEAYYHWCRRRGSAIGQGEARIREKDLTILDAYYQIWTLCREKGAPLRDAAAGLYLRTVLGLILACDAAGVEWNRAQDFDRLGQVISEESPPTLVDRLVWWKLEVMVWLKRHHAPLGLVRLFEALARIPGKGP